MVAAAAAAGQAHPLASGLRELGEHGRCDRLLARAFQHRRRAIRSGAARVMLAPPCAQRPALAARDAATPATE